MKKFLRSSSRQGSAESAPRLSQIISTAQPTNMPAPILRPSPTGFNQRPGMPLRQASESAVSTTAFGARAVAHTHSTPPPLRTGSSSSTAASPSDVLPGAAPIAAGHSIWTAPLEALPLSVKKHAEDPHARPASSAGSYSHGLRFFSSSSTQSLPGLLADSSSFPTVQSPPATSQSVSTPYEYKHSDSVENLGSQVPNKIRTSAFLRKRKPAPSFLDDKKGSTDDVPFSVPIPVYASESHGPSPSASQENLSKPGTPSATSSHSALPSALVGSQTEIAKQAFSEKKLTLDSLTSPQSAETAGVSSHSQLPKRPQLEPSLPTSMSVLDPWLQNRVSTSPNQSPIGSKLSNDAPSPSSTAPLSSARAKPQISHVRSNSSAMTARIAGPGPLLRGPPSRPSSVMVSPASGPISPSAHQSPSASLPSDYSGRSTPLSADVGSNPLLGILRAPPPPPKLDTNPLLLAVGDEASVPAAIATVEEDEDQEHMNESSPVDPRNSSRSPRYSQSSRPAVKSISASISAKHTSASLRSSLISEASLSTTSGSDSFEPPAAQGKDLQTQATLPVPTEDVAEDTPATAPSASTGTTERDSALVSPLTDALTHGAEAEDANEVAVSADKAEQNNGLMSPLTAALLGASESEGNTEPSLAEGSAERHSALLSPLTAALLSAPEGEGAAESATPVEHAERNNHLASPLNADLLSPPEDSPAAQGAEVPSNSEEGHPGSPVLNLPLAPISAQAVAAPITPPSDSAQSGMVLDEPMKIPQGNHVGNPLLIGFANLPVQQTPPPPTWALPKVPASAVEGPTKQPDSRGPQWRSSSAAAQLLRLPFNRPKVRSPAASTTSPWEDDDELRSAVEAASAYMMTQSTLTPSPRGEAPSSLPTRSTSHRTADSSRSAPPPPSYSAAASSIGSTHKVDESEKPLEEGVARAAPAGPTGYFASVRPLTAATEGGGGAQPISTPSVLSPLRSIGTGPGGGGRPLPRIPTL